MCGLIFSNQLFSTKFYTPQASENKSMTANVDATLPEFSIIAHSILFLIPQSKTLQILSTILLILFNRFSFCKTCFFLFLPFHQFIAYHI